MPNHSIAGGPATQPFRAEVIAGREPATACRPDMPSSGFLAEETLGRIQGHLFPPIFFPP